MPQTISSIFTSVLRRTSDSPAPTADSELASESLFEQERHTQMDIHDAEPPSKYKHRGLVRVIGGLFKRKNSNADDAMVSSDNEASQRRTSSLSRWSHRHSLPDAPSDVVVMTEPVIAPIREIDSTSSPAHMEVPVPQTPVEAKVEKPKKETKPKLSFVNIKRSPSKTSELASESSDEPEEEPLPVSFLFYGGSDADCTFQPDLTLSEYDDLPTNQICPLLQLKMPVFLSVPLAKKTRRNCILSDPKEYEL